MKIKLYTCGGEHKSGPSELPLGIGYLKSNCDADISIVTSREDLIGCDLIGLSSVAHGIPEALEILAATDIPVIIGGQATLWPDLDDHDRFPFEAVCCGEGELWLADFLNVSCAYDGQNIDTLTFPFRGECQEAIPILTSRGCPFKCRNCSSSAFWGRPRWHSPEYVIEDILAAATEWPDATEIYIQDDLFFANKKRLRAIHELWLAHGLQKRFSARGFTRADCFDYEMALMMQTMNFRHVRFGAESGSDRILKWLGKGTTVAQNQKVVDICEQVGLKCIASFMYDYPIEEEEDREATRQFFVKNRDKMEVGGSYRFRPLPGTACYNGEDPREFDMRIRESRP